MDGEIYFFFFPPFGLAYRLKKKSVLPALKSGDCYKSNHFPDFVLR